MATRQTSSSGKAKSPRIQVVLPEQLCQRLADLAVNTDNHAFIRECGRQMHANAMIQAGLAPDGNEMAARLQEFMLQLASQKSALAL